MLAQALMFLVVLGRYMYEISFGTPAILSGVSVFLLSPSRQMPEYYLEIGHDHFLLHFLQLIILLLYHLTQHSLSYWKWH
jgi:hypothetical protein